MIHDVATYVRKRNCKITFIDDFFIFCFGVATSKFDDQRCDVCSQILMAKKKELYLFIFVFSSIHIVTLTYMCFELIFPGN